MMGHQTVTCTRPVVCGLCGVYRLCPEADLNKRYPEQYREALRRHEESVEQRRAEEEARRQEKEREREKEKEWEREGREKIRQKRAAPTTDLTAAAAATTSTSTSTLSRGALPPPPPTRTEPWVREGGSRGIGNKRRGPRRNVALRRKAMETKGADKAKDH